MDLDLAAMVALLSAMAIFFFALSHTVNGMAATVDALGNLWSAVERFISRFRRMVKALRRRRNLRN